MAQVWWIPRVEKVPKYSFARKRGGYRKPWHRTRIWSRICKAGSFVKLHFIWSIGEGEAINVLQDPWLCMIPISKWPKFINVGNLDAPLMVHSLITPDRQWDMSLLTSLFLADMMTQIKDIILAQEHWADQLCWGSIGQSHVSLTDVYPLIAHPIHDGPTNQYSWICKLKVLKRVKLFGWQLIWHGLLLNFCFIGGASYLQINLSIYKRNICNINICDKYFTGIKKLFMISRIRDQL